ncbi:rubrerythrin family protein [Halomicrobium salinisoli]|uniref:rubrerythrin family protein n=1 Tax=Halomicrobium salinisoli TaxID=2878391 RepID=UPI001CF0C706|nr:rubrerythrin family protein [Halomicrobium salinisoli]
MEPDQFVDAVREENDTALSRLGSSKALYALTEGEMEDDVVRARAADLAGYGAETFEDWVAEADADVYRAAIDLLGDQRDEADPDRELGDRPAVYDALAALDGEDERLGGFVAWTLVYGSTLDQLTGYFTGQADPQTASTFRGMSSDVDELREGAFDALAEADQDAARSAAEDVIEAAYDEYFETLEDLGVNPKPVC